MVLKSNNLILSALVFIFSNLSFAAAADKAAIDEQQKRLNEASVRFNSTFADTQEKVKKAHAAADLAENAYKQAELLFNKAQEELDKEAGSVLGFNIGEGSSVTKNKLAATKKARDDARIKYDDANASLKKYNDQYLDMYTRKRDLNSQKSKVGAALDSNQAEQTANLKADIERQNKDFELIINNQGLQTSFAELSKKMGSVDLANVKLNAKLDNAILGNYLKEKMHSMLNDKNTFCAAKNYCDDKGGPVSKSAIDKLFTGSTSINNAPPSSTTNLRSSGGAR